MINRKEFLYLLSAGVISPKLHNPYLNYKGNNRIGDSFFRLVEKNDRWWLLSPSNKFFFSLGINHVDPSVMRFPDNIEIWNSKYHNHMENWLGQVKLNLTDWGFNCLGWNQEVVIIKPEMHRHSRSFTFEEYQWLDMPYFHMLPLIASHQWEWETKLPDICGSAFSDWCDFVARDECSRFKNDPNLIGYFFTDCPTWIHSNKNNAWKAPIFDPEMEKTDKGRKEIFEKAGHYYKTITDAIKRYDPNHLICGDRYEANAPISEEVISAAIPYTDIFSFQCFSTPEDIYKKLEKWTRFTKKPVILADFAVFKQAHYHWPPEKDLTQDDIRYDEILKIMRTLNSCVGIHLCGAYLKNNVRRYGLMDKQEHESETTSGIKKANLEHLKWFENLSNQP